MVVCASVTGQLTRTVPRGSVCTCATASSAASACVAHRDAVAVVDLARLRQRELRVVRCSSRTPSRASSSATRRDSFDLGTPSARPAAAKPPRSTTSAKKTHVVEVLHASIVL